MRLNTVEEEIIQIKTILRKDSEPDDDYQTKVSASKAANYSLHEYVSVQSWLDQKRTPSLEE